MIQINHTTYPEILKTKTDAQLRWIMKDASEAIRCNPEGEKVGYYADEINYCGMELARRREVVA